MKDLRSIRPTPADVDAEFTPPRRATVLHQVLASEMAPVSHRGWWLAAAGVAAAVTITAVLVVSPMVRGTSAPIADPVPPAGSLADSEPAPSASSPAAEQSAASPTPQPPKSLVKYDLGTVTSPKVLEKISTVTGDGTTAKGKYLHTVIVSQQTKEGTRVLDGYTDADGWQWRHDTMTAENDSGNVMESWKIFGGDFTKDDVSSLPADPDALDAALRARGGSNSTDERVFKGIDEALHSGLASPELRAAAIKVLQKIAENPQKPAPDKEGVLATPKLEVAELALPDGSPGYRVMFTDQGSRPGVTQSLVLDATGQLLETSSTYDGSDPEFPDPKNYASQVQVREYVDQLPAEFVSRLGTERVEKEG